MSSTESSAPQEDGAAEEVGPAVMPTETPVEPAETASAEQHPSPPSTPPSDDKQGGTASVGLAATTAEGSGGRQDAVESVVPPSADEAKKTPNGPVASVPATPAERRKAEIAAVDRLLLESAHPFDRPVRGWQVPSWPLGESNIDLRSRMPDLYLPQDEDPEDFIDYSEDGFLETVISSTPDPARGGRTSLDDLELRIKALKVREADLAEIMWKLDYQVKLFDKSLDQAARDAVDESATNARERLEMMTGRDLVALVRPGATNLPVPPDLSLSNNKLLDPQPEVDDEVDGDLQALKAFLLQYESLVTVPEDGAADLELDLDTEEAQEAAAIRAVEALRLLGVMSRHAAMTVAQILWTPVSPFVPNWLKDVAWDVGENLKAPVGKLPREMHEPSEGRFAPHPVYHTTRARLMDRVVESAEYVRDLWRLDAPVGAISLADWRVNRAAVEYALKKRAREQMLSNAAAVAAASAELAVREHEAAVTNEESNIELDALFSRVGDFNTDPVGTVGRAGQFATTAVMLDLQSFSRATFLGRYVLELERRRLEAFERRERMEQRLDEVGDYFDEYDDDAKEPMPPEDPDRQLPQRHTGPVVDLHQLFADEEPDPEESNPPAAYPGIYDTPLAVSILKSAWDEVDFDELLLRIGYFWVFGVSYGAISGSITGLAIAREMGYRNRRLKYNTVLNTASRHITKITSKMVWAPMVVMATTIVLNSVPRGFTTSIAGPITACGMMSLLLFNKPHRARGTALLSAVWFLDEIFRKSHTKRSSILGDYKKVRTGMGDRTVW